jgi:hypothetical protein
MNNPNTVNHSKELFSDKYAEAILKIAKTLTRKPPFVKNTLNDLDMWVGKEPTKKRCTYIYHEIYITLIACNKVLYHVLHAHADGIRSRVICIILP